MVGLLKNFNEISEKLNSFEGALQILWCNFELLSVVKKFWETAEKHWSTEVSSYSEVFGEILENGKILQ